jgi:general secretion pathway protein A
MNPVRRGSGDLPAGADFLATPLREAVVMLRAGLAREDPLLLLTGHAGVGKTTVARRLLEELDAQRYALGGIFGSYGEGDALMSLVVQDLGVRPQRAGDAFLTLEQFLRRSDNAGREAVLLIDEAHALDADALRQLWQLAAPPAGGRPRLQVVLVAQQLPDAVTELTRSGRTPPIGTRCHLRPLEMAETRELVLNRIRSRGGTGQPAFSNEALDAIHERSGGVLRRINLLCDRICMSLAMEGRHEVSAQVVAAVDAQLRGELRGPGLPVQEPVPGVVRVAGPVSTYDEQPYPSATTPSDPNDDERATAPAGTGAPGAISWRTQWPALRRGRWPGVLLGGMLPLVSFALLALAMAWFFRAKLPAPAGDPAAEVSAVQMPDNAMARAQGQRSAVAAPAASAMASTAAAPRSESGPPPQAATPAVPATAPATAQSPPPTSVPCSGPADTLGLCAAATAALPVARVEDTGPIAPRTEPASCMPARAALGLCDAP